jgi:hypothetical protein
MTGYAVLAAIVCLFVSDALFRTVVAWAKPLLPENLQEERKASYSLGALIWESSFPDDLRRKYLLSIAFGVIAGLCVVLIAYNTDHSNWAVFFAPAYAHDLE